MREWEWEPLDCRSRSADNWPKSDHGSGRSPLRRRWACLGCRRAGRTRCIVRAELSHPSTPVGSGCISRRVSRRHDPFCRRLSPPPTVLLRSRCGSSSEHPASAVSEPRPQPVHRSPPMETPPALHHDAERGHDPSGIGGPVSVMGRWTSRLVVQNPSAPPQVCRLATGRRRARPGSPGGGTRLRLPALEGDDEEWTGRSREGPGVPSSWRCCSEGRWLRCSGRCSVS